MDTPAGKTVSERIHDETMHVTIVQDGDARYSIAITGTTMMNIGNPRKTFGSAQEAKAAADLAVDRTGHRCYWSCSKWS
jgi:hypothetical protein